MQSSCSILVVTRKPEPSLIIKMTAKEESLFANEARFGQDLGYWKQPCSNA
jgi:hypothetical protein